MHSSALVKHEGRHRWAQSWPGNYCLCCGLDHALEDMMFCPDCSMPCCPEEEGVVPVVTCDRHQKWIDTPCPCTKEHEDGWRM